MRGMKLSERFKSTQVHALNSSETSGRRNKACDGSNSAKKIRSFLSMSKSNHSSTTSGIANLVAPFQLPSIDTLEPCIEPYHKPINLVETLAELYHRQECCHQSQKALLFVEQYSLLCNLRDQKLLRRCLRTARQNSVDVLSKVVLSAWLRFERREDELEGVSSMECGGGCILECPTLNLVHGFNPCSIKDRCQCGQESKQETSTDSVCLPDEEKKDVCFCIGNEEINCVRLRIAALSDPFKAMLYGGFAESKMRKIDFTKSGVCSKGMMAVELYSRAKRLDFFTPMTVLELLSFANRFCCEEMKSACDAYLASIVGSVDDALILFDYGLEERAPILVASCLQVFLRELPKTLYNLKVMKIFCSSEAKERLAMVRYDSFLLYYFLSQVAMEESMVSITTMMLLERLGECAKERWQKALAYHQLGCVMLERKEYKDSQRCFEVAAEAGHVYSLAGVARTKHKQGQQCSAYKLISSLIFEHKPTGWMYQERALHNTGRETSFDLDVATELDPSLSYPYKYRALAKVEEKQIMDGIVELDKIIGFKLSPDCLELRAWMFIALQNYESAMRDIRALLTLEPNYITSHGKITGKYLVHLLSNEVQQKSQAECWMQLYEQWSSVDDIGSLAIIHQMLENEPRKSLLEFRQSLLLLRLNCQKAAMHSLRMARNHSSSIQERLIYEGWILYDTGYREETLARADRSITIQKSFEAFFLKAYVLADTNLDAESSSYVIQLLEAALNCPSDGLRKGQALNNLGSIYVDCGKLDLAKACYENALAIRHTRAHQGLARVYHQKNQRKAAYDEMTKLIEKAASNASAYEKRSEYCDREMAKGDLDIATQLDPLRTYPYRYRAAVMMDEQKETEAVEELTKAISFKPDLQMLHLRAAFYESMGDLNSALQDCQAALCLDPNHTDTLDLYQRAQKLRF
ncbi:putative chromatin remodeling & transcription regulator BTB-POZ family [Lupinus albus]|uniref:Putative chromatin remodeling & transcription regulator BTB-POZ family n=1 Tax=Lupinus albus TaxID=3870 RepID=A0A6A4PAN5_LUPAL|nr:putative chromatin remodeling & transcription regulator BTB-POZ family [Lupinus albus]